MLENKATEGKGYRSEEIEARKLAKKIVKHIKKDFPLVDFCDIDTNLISFGTPKENNYNGTQIPILYNGKPMYVKYSGVTPFGIRFKW